MSDEVEQLCSVHLIHTNYSVFVKGTHRFTVVKQRAVADDEVIVKVFVPVHHRQVSGSCTRHTNSQCVVPVVRHLVNTHL